jgi:hypothetical protein
MCSELQLRLLGVGAAASAEYLAQTAAVAATTHFPEEPFASQSGRFVPSYALIGSLLVDN